MLDVSVPVLQYFQYFDFFGGFFPKNQYMKQSLLYVLILDMTCDSFSQDKLVA